MNRTARNILVYALLVLLLIWGINALRASATAPEEIALSRLYELIDQGKVAKATLVLDADSSVSIEGELSSGGIASESIRHFVAEIPRNTEALLQQRLEEAGVQFETERAGISFGQIFFTLLPYLLLFGFMIFLIMQMQGGGSRVMSFGKAKVKQVSKDQPKVTFKDVAGLEEAVEELQEIKDFLQAPQKFRAMGAKIPKGVLLYGPPGAGKTLLARAVAGEAGVPFFSISGSDFVEMFVGVGASRVRDLFEQAKSSAPAIVFIDEIDAVGRHRGAGLGGGHDEREQTLNQLLVEMDGFDVKTGVILIAATNRPDILDPALLRPGRFDRQVVIDRPDLNGRLEILHVHARGKPMASEVDLEILARQTPGFTGADLANLINEGALLAARRNKPEITMDELEEAIDRVVAGPERRSRLISDEEKVVIAYHEGGHALVGYVMPNANPIHKVTIIPRGRALGYTQALPLEDRYMSRRSEMVDELAMLLGGRTAEELIFADPTTGAANDIEKATQMARKMVMEFGMSDRLGPMQYGRPDGEVFLGRDYARQQDYSDEVASLIDEEVRKLISQAHEEAREILATHRDALDRIADALLERETIDSKEVAQIFADVPKWESTPNGARRIQAPKPVGTPRAAAQGAEPGRS